MRTILGAGLLLVAMVGRDLRAEVARHGDTVTAGAYTLRASSDADVSGLGGELSLGDLVFQLRTDDGAAVCAAEASRDCQELLAGPGWLLRRCELLASCAAGPGTVQLRARTTQSFWTHHLAHVLELDWTKTSQQPIHVPLVTHIGLAGSAAATSNLVTLDAGATSAVSTQAAGWSAACGAPYAVDVGGTLALALLARGSGADALACRATSTNDSVELGLGRLQPSDGWSYALTLAAWPHASSVAPEAALLAWRGRWVSTPTAAVRNGAVWQLDGDELLSELGIAGLAMDPNTDNLVWVASPGGAGSRPNAMWLVRGHLPGDKSLVAYDVTSEAPRPAPELALHPLDFAAVRVFTPAGAWEPFTPGAPMCAKGADRSCLEVAGPFPFGGLELALAQAPTEASVSWTYWNGTQWSALALDAASSSADLMQSGFVRWAPPSDWAPTSVTLASGGTAELYAVRAKANGNYRGDAPAATRIASDLLLVEHTAAITAARDFMLSYNRPPLARLVASSLAAASNEVVELDGGESSDPEGQPLTFIWRQSSGPAQVSLDAGGAPQVSVRAPAPGLYVFELAVSDGELTSAPVYATVRVGTAVELAVGGCSASGRAAWVWIAGALLAVWARRGRLTAAR